MVFRKKDQIVQIYENLNLFEIKNKIRNDLTKLYKNWD